MEELSIRKKTAVVTGYFAGESYDGIARRAGVSKGAVVGIVSALKSGQFPGVQEPAEQVELLREIAVELRKAKVAAEQAIIGLASLSRLREMHIEPAEIERWAALYRQLAADERRAEAFINCALYLQGLLERTGLSPEGLQEKVESLEQDVARLEPMARQVREDEQQLAQLLAEKQTATEEIAQLEKRRAPLQKKVAQKEQRDAELTERVGQLEARAQAAEERLGRAGRGLTRLQKLGLSDEDLAGLTERIAGVAQRHGIPPADLRNRLISELERLDEALSLEVLLESRRAELTNIEQQISSLEQEKEALTSAVDKLLKENSSLHAAMEEERDCVRKGMRAIARIAENAGTKMAQRLTATMEDTLREFRRLRDDTLTLGQELGRYQGIIESNEWLQMFCSLARGDGNINASQVRVSGLVVLRAVKDWAWQNRGRVSVPWELTEQLELAEMQLERWQI